MRNKTQHSGDFVIVLIKYVSEKNQSLDINDIDTSFLVGFQGVSVESNRILCTECSFEEVHGHLQFYTHTEQPFAFSMHQIVQVRRLPKRHTKSNGRPLWSNSAYFDIG